MHNEYMKIARKLAKNAKALADAFDEREEFAKSKTKEEREMINEKNDKKINELVPEFHEAIIRLKKYI